MAPSSSTRTIPEVVINYVKHQNSLGLIPTREDVKIHLKGVWTLQPWVFGSSKDGMSSSDWESSVYPTFRSMYSRAKTSSKGQKGLESIHIEVIDDIDYIFHPSTWMRHSAGASYKNLIGMEEEVVKDAHTTAQFILCSIARKANLFVYVPNKDRSKKADNGMTVAKEFSEILVNDFEGFNAVTKEIDVIFLKEMEGKLVPIKAFEVENSTSVKTGLVRLKALGVQGTIVSTQKAYKKIFDDNMTNAFPELIHLLKYAELSKIKRFSENINDFENSLDANEILLEINNKI